MYSVFTDLLLLYVYLVVPFQHYIFQIIPEEPVELPEFKNLKILSLDKCDLSDNFQLLKHFLQNSPNLEKLTLRLCEVFMLLFWP